mmetsp:Transcript_4782/g.7586  ORF Transcript_4782/g.7586 Transcript_4782/m.7586 type:complete len:113 (-) Transcript_4782:311-649(-)
MVDRQCRDFLPQLCLRLKCQLTVVMANKDMELTPNSNSSSRCNSKCTDNSKCINSNNGNNSKLCKALTSKEVSVCSHRIMGSKLRIVHRIQLMPFFRSLIRTPYMKCNNYNS